MSTLKVTIFHSDESDDIENALNLYHNLKLQSWITPWIDEEDVLVGQNPQREALNQLEKTDSLIICFSESGLNCSGLLNRLLKKTEEKLDSLLNNDNFVIPVKLSECEVPSNFEEVYPVKLFEENGYLKLLAALKHKADELKIDTTESIQSISNLIGAEWKPLNKIYDTTIPPKVIKFPDKTVVYTQTFETALTRIAKRLAKLDKLPQPPTFGAAGQGDYLLNTEPVHQNGKKFSDEVQLSNGVWLEKRLVGKYPGRNIFQLVEKSDENSKAYFFQ